jgi:hypothetical protein
MTQSGFQNPGGSAGAAHFAGSDSLARSARAEALRDRAAAGMPQSARPPAPCHGGTGRPWPRPPACLTADRLDRPPGRARVAVCGLVIVRQRPGSAKGVLFITLEDETGVVNVVVWARVYEAHRRAVLAGRLLRVTGRIQRDGAVVHVVAETIEDVSALLDTLAERRFEPPHAPADEVRRPQAEGSRPPGAGAAGRAGTLIRNAAPRAMHPREQAKLLFRRPPDPPG